MTLTNFPTVSSGKTATFFFSFFFNHVLYLLVAKICVAFINVLVSQRIGVIFSK